MIRHITVKEMKYGLGGNSTNCILVVVAFIPFTKICIIFSSPFYIFFRKLQCCKCSWDKEKTSVSRLSVGYFLQGTNWSLLLTIDGISSK